MASIPARQIERSSQQEPAQSSSPRQTDAIAENDSRPDQQSAVAEHVADPSRDYVFSEITPSPLGAHAEAEAQEEPRKCWICFSEEHDADEPSSEWRSPCTCALTAHESCLLDWVADLEAPSSRRATGSPAKVQCPQCKAQIHLARPRSLVVDGVRAAERMALRLILPGALFATTYTMYQGLFMHGVATIYTVFGMEDGFRILQPLYEYPDATSSLSLSVAVHKAAKHFRLCSGLSLIPPALILSRTSLGDPVLPILPMIFLASSQQRDAVLVDFSHWPPSAAISFAILPYIRAMYNAYYQRFWTPHERRWLKMIRPRQTNEDQDENGGEGRADDIGDVADGDDAEGGLLDVHIDVDLNIWEGQVDPDAIEQGAAAGFQVPGQQQDALDDAPLDDNAAPAPVVPRNAEQLQDEQQRHQRQQRVHQAARGERQGHNMVLSLYQTAQSVLGALVFPAVAASVGSLLKTVLPYSWTSIPQFAISVSRGAGTRRGGQPTGLLQQRWGRTIVGGCLFVVLRDAIFLYVRWRTARAHTMRKVLDHPSKVISRTKDQEAQRKKTNTTTC